MSNCKGWQNSIRHNLSLNKAFVRQKERDDGGRKGGTWSINPCFSIGSFKRVKANDLDSSCWEPEESVFGSSRHADLPTFERIVELKDSEASKKVDYAVPCKIKQSVNHSEIDYFEPDKSLTEINETMPKKSDILRTSLTGLDQFRRKSVEEFLQMDKVILDTMPQNVKNNTSLCKRKKNKQNQKADASKEDEWAVPLPPSLLPSTRSLSSNLCTEGLKETTNLLLDLDSQHRGFPFEGSMDYWEQYDPESVRNDGLAVITSNENEFPVCVEALCFLCGSEGKYKLRLDYGCI